MGFVDVEGKGSENHPRAPASSLSSEHEERTLECYSDGTGLLRSLCC